MQVYENLSVSVNDVKEVHKIFLAEDQISVSYDDKIVMITLFMADVLIATLRDIWNRNG